MIFFMITAFLQFCASTFSFTIVYLDEEALIPVTGAMLCILINTGLLLLKTALDLLSGALYVYSHAKIIIQSIADEAKESRLRENVPLPSEEMETEMDLLRHQFKPTMMVREASIAAEESAHESLMSTLETSVHIPSRIHQSTSNHFITEAKKIFKKFDKDESGSPLMPKTSVPSSLMLDISCKWMK